VNQAEYAPIGFAPAAVVVEETQDGGYLLSSPMPLAPFERSLGVMLRRWAAESPETVFLGERDASGHWRLITYAEANRHADAIAQALIDRGLGCDRPVMVLSGNSIGHALIMLGGFLAGVPVVPVSAAYSLLSQDFAKLRTIFGEIRPALIYVERGDLFARALDALDLSGVEIATAGGETDRTVTPLATLLETVPTQQVSQRLAQVAPESVAKVLYSSGSTGTPKGVINSHGMLCANQQMIAQVWPFMEETPPVLVDWLPWNHTFGGNHNFNMVLKRGGTLYIDGGKPLPGLVEQTVRNLADISPTIYFNVPAGFAMLLPFLESDEALRNKFFGKLQLIFYAAAALPQDLWQRLEAVSLLATGRKVPMTSSWGATETSPAVTSAHFPIDRAGVIGLPLPGVTLKMVPDRGKFELRVKGPNVTPGYLHQPDLTAAAFDEEGFYRIGDAGAFADPADAAKGIVFKGRVAEDFKLSTGTWVHVGMLRVGILAATAPAIQDLLVTGHDRDYIGILAWPNIQGCRGICGSGEGEPTAEGLLRSNEVARYLREALTAYNAQQEGSSTQVRRIMLMTAPPSIDANEITDKGYINQRAALEMRKVLVEKLYGEEPAPEVIVV
jgi:feruloyl-CoA synthase